MTGIGQVAAVLPERQRVERERPFWQALAAAHGWARVVDAGCGGGFHRRLLTALGVEVVAFDRALAPLVQQRPGPLLAADLTAPPLRAASFDAAFCLGNTLSLLPDRSMQRRALAALGELLKPGGTLVLQAEDASITVEAGAKVRTRALPDGRIHVRAYERHGNRIHMLVGIVAPGDDAPLETVRLLPTSASQIATLARSLGLAPVPLRPPATGAVGTWWLALRAGA
ncbi:MAG: methyltransferase domain-containing protein [Thermoanaerobaculaceae bacterium]|nr:methyltransferase domain-containing protein [Thermoanaerobaculaceae bacterium]MDI9622447.1 class I SAM-dependent methyltransferase [Acidobacteriota bacterium]NLH11202.1 class I SAM-dependent methyltransferase [Holophagae bacterium]HPW54348.1 class I SAM-dependent methyltransferase [Thermoanaerobaculaceae bacterium]